MLVSEDFCLVFSCFPSDRSIFSNFLGEYKNIAITGNIRKTQKLSLIIKENVTKVTLGALNGSGSLEHYQLPWTGWLRS